MSSIFTRRQIKTKIFACGGFGMNILSGFMKTEVATGFGHISVAYVDTSGSNVPLGINPETLYLFKNMDGGGKKRKLTYEAILPMIPDVLEKFPAEDFNIVLHSASGASGSTVGPAMVNELLRAGKHVIVVQIGTTASKIEVDNTIGTIRSYANMASIIGRPVVSYYRENNEKTTRAEVDSQVQSALSMLALLFSSENEGLDTADLKNLLDYHNVTGFKPELSTFDFHCKAITLPENLVVQAAAILFPKGANSADGHENGDVLIEYRAEGFMPDSRSKLLLEKTPVYSIVYTGDFSARMQELEARVKKFVTAAKANQTANLSVSLVGGNDVGVVF